MFVLIFVIFCFMLGFEALMLPKSVLSLPLAEAAPVPADAAAATVRSAASAALAAITGGGGEPPFRVLRASPNISVVMPCFGQTQYLDEGLRSVLAQQYPAAEILVIDDGSEDRCGEAARRLLDGALAPLRRRNVRTLQAWWGWSAADLKRFRDEIVLTPNRGVAHARNTGIRRARGDWIMCLDADDTVSDNYFLLAMMHVAQVPATSLVYGLA